MATEFLGTCRRHWRLVGLAALVAVSGALLAAHRAVIARAGLAPAHNPWGNAYLVRSDEHRLTVTTDARTAENCATLAARFAGARAVAACAHSVLTVTFPPARAPGRIEEGRSRE